MINWITDISLFLAHQKFKKKPMIKSIDDGSYEFQEHHSVYCPKCNCGFSFKNIKYCECNEYHNGHFHFKCEGANPMIPIGCSFKWIMKSKS